MNHRPSNSREWRWARGAALYVLCLLFSLILPALAGEAFTAKVVGLSDGDTLTVLRGGREQVKLRLHGVDSPEDHQAFGTKARQFTGDLVFGKVVSVEVHERDRYGRVVADVYTEDGKHLNAELIRAGMAWWYRRYAPKDTKLAALEAEARAAKRGLWADANPIPPWEFRNGKPVARSDPPKEKESQPNPDTVYITDTGRKYHKDGCRYLALSKKPIPLKDAKAKGLTACSACRP
jgi:micrococcal nuclease